MKISSGDSRGFSLAEVMIASAILGVITLGLMSMTQNQMSALNYMEDKMSVLSLGTEIKQNLLLASVCKSTLEGLKIQDGPIPIAIRDQNGKTLFSDTVKEKRRYETVEIDKLTLQNVDVPDHVGSGWVEIVAETKRLRKGAGPQKLRPARARIRVTVDTDRIIRNCDTGRVTALDCGRHPHGKVVTSYTGECPNRIQKRDICIGGIWLLYEKVVDPSC
ncbi:MAG: prepilin-type N-terminal cleavage/methylation domain-containing protein [Pseudomonadota bacterium]